MGSMIRAAGLRGLPALIDDLGGSGAVLLARFGVDTAALETDDAVIGSLAVSRIMEAAAAELACPDLGLRLAARQDIAVLGPLAIAIENSATLGDALDCAIRFLFVHSPALTVAKIPDPSGRPGVVALRIASTEIDRLPPQASGHGLGLLHRITVMLNGGRYGLRSVHLPHRPLAPVGRYTEFFGADVRFEQAAALLRVPRGLLDTSVAGGSNRMLREVALDYMRSHFPPPGRVVGERVRQLVTQSLGTSPVGIAAVGRLLRTHPRTLQRRLAEEGTSFDRILDDARRQTAYRLITTTDASFAQVTAMVGLAEQSALSRAVRRWYGVSPRELRREGDRGPNPVRSTV
jgi:AraC-like DNA-binding protein